MARLPKELQPDYKLGSNRPKNMSKKLSQQPGLTNGNTSARFEMQATKRAPSAQAKSAAKAALGKAYLQRQASAESKRQAVSQESPRRMMAQKATNTRKILEKEFKKMRTK
jgi:hypothetical protein